MAEEQFEHDVIKALEKEGWIYRADLSNTKSEKLIDNWRDVLNRNNVKELKGKSLSDSEFSSIMHQINSLTTVYETQLQLVGVGQKSLLQITRDDGSPLLLTIFYPDNIAGGQSTYEVVNQVIFNPQGVFATKRIIDIALLINGIPVAHIELKDEFLQNQWNAFEQLKKYCGEGMYTGLFGFVQVLSIMSANSGHYFARPNKPQDFNKSFVFSWRDNYGNDVNRYNLFIKEVFGIPALHRLVTVNIIPNHASQSVMIMRSYQIQATRAIMQRMKEIQRSGNISKKGGYIWHTTGSGKTVTSFKVAQLLVTRPEITNVFFIVDRVNLVDQTYDNFNDYAYEHLKPRILKIKQHQLNRQLKTPNSKIFVMSLQALTTYVKQGNVNTDRNIIIMDEAHRSSEGDSVKAIKRAFPNTTWFGFTGTPNFYDNESLDIITSRQMSTKDIFGKRLHQYTIKDAIGDKNVLGFDVTYYDAQYSLADSNLDELDADTQSIYNSASFRASVAKDIATNWSRHASGPIIQNVRQNPKMFHAILAVSGKQAAANYYQIFKENHPELNVAMTYSISDTSHNGLAFDESLRHAIQDYAAKYNKNGLLSARHPDRDYLRDIITRLAHKPPYQDLPKDQYIDLIIVSDQLLTGFDSKYVNMLYMDKIKREGDLIQAMSRTNRVFNVDSKPYGKVKFYRDPETMQTYVEDALKIYTLGGNDSQFDDGLDVRTLPTSYLNDTNILARPLDDMCQTINAKLSELQLLSDENFDQMPKSDSDKSTFKNLALEIMSDLNELTQRGYDVYEMPELLITKDQFGALTARTYDINALQPETEQLDLTNIAISLALVHQEIIDYDKLCELINLYAKSLSTDAYNAVIEHANRDDSISTELVVEILNDIKSGSDLVSLPFTAKTMSGYITRSREKDVELLILNWLEDHPDYRKNSDTAPGLNKKIIYDLYNRFTPNEPIINNSELRNQIQAVQPPTITLPRFHEFRTNIYNLLANIYDIKHIK